MGFMQTLVAIAHVFKLLPKGLLEQLFPAGEDIGPMQAVGLMLFVCFCIGLMIRSGLDEGDEAVRARNPALYPRGRAVMLQIALPEAKMPPSFLDGLSTAQAAELLLAREALWTPARLRVAKGSPHDREKLLRIWFNHEFATKNNGGNLVLFSFFTSDHGWPDADSPRAALQVLAERGELTDLLVTTDLGENDLQRRGLQVSSC